ncbi:MAG: hypothetical protein IT378_00285 [Sandaracinaceae bacterium]|nr:hypothetical protein [Sandaracinaceae bacterium]
MRTPIDPIALEQSLIVSRDVPFARIDAALSSLAWTRDERTTVTAPLIAGEPELAGWRHRLGWPLITYTFNPVVHLRVLEVAALAPEQRAEIAGKIAVMSHEDIASLLSSSTARARLCGVLAAREIEAFDLRAHLDRLGRDAEPAVREAAKEAAHALDETQARRVAALAMARVVAASAEPLLEELAQGQPDRVLSLAPRAADYGAVFHDRIAQDVQRAYEPLWKEHPPRVAPGERYSELEVVAVPAGMLRSHNELSREVPRGYRSVAGWLRPERVWVFWRYHPPGERAGVSYDGLVHVDGHWAWFPKPYRAIGEILARRARP